jgi:hypothetical protein
MPYLLYILPQGPLRAIIIQTRAKMEKTNTYTQRQKTKRGNNITYY